MHCKLSRTPNAVTSDVGLVLEFDSVIESHSNTYFRTRTTKLELGIGSVLLKRGTPSRVSTPNRTSIRSVVFAGRRSYTATTRYWTIFDFVGTVACVCRSGLRTGWLKTIPTNPSFTTGWDTVSYLHHDCHVTLDPSHNLMSLTH